MNRIPIELDSKKPIDLRFLQAAFGNSNVLLNFRE